MRTDSSPSQISISVTSEPSSSSMRVLILRISMACPSLVSGCWCEARDRRLQRQFVSERTESADHAGGDIGEIRMAAERLACVDVGNMHFDERDRDPEQRIAQRHAGVREPAGIDHDEADAL